MTVVFVILGVGVLAPAFTLNQLLRMLLRSVKVSVKVLRALCSTSDNFRLLLYLFSPEDLWCSAGDVNDKVSRLQTYNQLIAVIIVYNITFARECCEVLTDVCHTDIHGLKSS